VKEELQDLLAYLNNLPPEIRRSGAFMAYEQRAGELGRELILSSTLLFARQLPQELSNELVADETVEYARLQEFYSGLTQRYEQAAKHNLFAIRTTRWGVLVTAVASLLFGASSLMSTPSLTGLVVALSVATASLALLSAWLFGDRAREHERVACHLASLRDEIAHSYGPAGEVLTPSEYYTASTKRIEQLLEEIKADVGRDRAAV